MEPRSDWDKLLDRVPMERTETEDTVTFHKRQCNWGTVAQQLGEFLAGVVNEVLEEGKPRGKRDALGKIRCGRFSVDLSAVAVTDEDVARAVLKPIATALMKRYRYLRDLHDSHPAGGSPTYLENQTVADIQFQVALIAQLIFPNHRDWLELSERVKERNDRAYRKTQIPRNLRRAVFERDDYRCRRCGDRFELAVDHVIPESKGGRTTLENLQALCRPCNSRKGNRQPEN